jgi:hypothetical protein
MANAAVRSRVILSEGEKAATSSAHSSERELCRIDQRRGSTSGPVSKALREGNVDANLETLANFAEILGAIVVIGGVAFAVIQIRQFRRQRLEVASIELVRSFHSPEFTRAHTFLLTLAAQLARRAQHSSSRPASKCPQDWGKSTSRGGAGTGRSSGSCTRWQRISTNAAGSTSVRPSSMAPSQGPKRGLRRREDQAWEGDQDHGNCRPLWSSCRRRDCKCFAT